MFELNSTLWAVMQSAVKKKSERVQYSSYWRQIAKAFHFNDIDGAKKWLYLSNDDLELLRQSIKQDYGLDLLFDDINSDRIELAKKSYKEKLAPIKPDDNYLLCRLPSQDPISLTLPTSASLRLSVEQVLTLLQPVNLADPLDQRSVDTILVVENLDIFDELGGYSLPLDMSRTLVIYRGAGIHSPKAVKKLLLEVTAQEESKALNIVAFVDIDPAGLQIAYSLGADSFLYPANMDEVLRLKQVNDVDDFESQHKQMIHLASLAQDNLVSEDVQNRIKYLAQKKISVKQQHLLAHNIVLRLIKI